MSYTPAPRSLAPAEAFGRAANGRAVLIDLRPTDDYLEVHIPGSIALLFESGPGLAGRARDCLPLELPLVLLEDARSDVAAAAAALRGKGFSVLGAVAEPVESWAAEHGPPASTDVHGGSVPPDATVLDVVDPGAARVDGAVTIPLEKLWTSTAEVGAGPVVIVAGAGVRAAMAVGMLERAGISSVSLWRRSA